MSRKNRNNDTKHGEVKTMVPNAEGQLENVETPEATPAATKTSGKRGKRDLNLDDPFLKQTIELKTMTNPKRKGSKSFQRFELYTPNMTVADFLKAGGTRGDVNWDTAHGHIVLHPVAGTTAPAEETPAE